MIQIAMVAIGGATGAVLRYAISVWAAARWGADFPYGTILVNLAGCFAIGVFMVVALERPGLSPYWRLLVTTGFLGGLTTFSSFSYETVYLLQQAHVYQALIHVSVNLLFGLGATGLGMILVRLILL